MVSAVLTRRFAIALMLAISLASVATADDLVSGRAIFSKLCAECHGARGEGVAGKTEEPLRGKRSLAELINAIDETMPEDEPELCTGDDAELVARYIYESFYAAQARSEQQQSRIELARLTVRQYRNSVADLLANFVGTVRVGPQRGLNAELFDSRNFRGDKRVEGRIDPQVQFDFSKDKPHPKISNADEFSLRWDGAVLAEDTGDYEFILRTENGARLWVNDRENALIDAWVSSKGRMSEQRGTIFLLGGRPYSIRLEMFKYKGDSASIALEWKPPQRARQVIPQRNLSPDRVPETFVAATLFPPDDSVSGYERGTAVSREWDQATTAAAIEAAQFVTARLDQLANTKSDAADRAEKVKQFCRQFAERAFRRPLTPELERLFVELHFKQSANLETAAKRSVLLVLKSPRFLYPEIGAGGPGDYSVASRMALGLWDSLPDQALLDAAAQGKLRTRDQIAAQAERMLDDPRAKSKLRYFFHHWLELKEMESLAKDKQLFPDFDEALVSDLRTSLDMFLDDVVWCESSDYRQLLVADYVFMNDRLASFYDVAAPATGTFEKISLDPQRQAGVVTHPYLLSTFAYHNLSSPIHRGVFVTRRLLGQALKPPPQATEFKDADFDPGMTTREKVTLLTQPAACQTCHTVINPLGFSLEHYDAVGRFREQENDKPIDTSSDFTTADGETVKLSGARSLAEFIAGSDHAHGHFVDQLFHQAVKQPINAYGANARRDLIDGFVASEFNIRKLLIEIMKVSVSFNPEP